MIVGFSQPVFQSGVGLCFYTTRGPLPPALDPLAISQVWTGRKHQVVLSPQGTASLEHTFFAN